jgi:hypothetical protein
MTREEIVKEARQLPVAEREAVVEEIARSIREETRGNASATGRSNLEEKLAAFHRLQGLLKTDVPPPTDEQLKEDYINYLAEKYS